MAPFPGGVLDGDISGDWASAIAIALINKPPQWPEFGLVEPH